MNGHEIYVNFDEIFSHIDNDGLLVGNNAYWAKEAVYNSSYINLDYYIPCSTIDNIKQQCEEKLSYYSSIGSIAKVECYVEFIQMLNSIWKDPDADETHN